MDYFRWVVVAVLFGLGAANAQLATRGEGRVQAAPGTAVHRTRLILKDGSYQVVMTYKVVGNNVQYVSAERGGVTELIPLDLVDLAATQRWEAQHSACLLYTSDAADE